jgi:hypothetical protein
VIGSRPARLASILAAAAVVGLAVLAVRWAGPGERPEPPEGDEVPRLAWFYKPPTDGTSAEDIVGRFAHITLTKHDESFLSELRAAGWAYKVAQYASLPWTRGPAGHERPGGVCTSPDRIAGNSFTWFAEDFCTRLHPHEGTFLHRADGERLYRDPGDGGGWMYAVDPGDPTWREFVAERIDQAFAGDAVAAPFGYEGMFLDEAWATRRQLLETYTNADGTLREYTDDEAWQTAMAGLVDLAAERIRAHGHRVWINTDHDATVYDAAVDGLMVENFAASWDGGYLAGDELVSLWRRLEENLALGRRLILVGQGDRGDVERMRYAYAAYLMIAHPRAAFRYSRDPDGYRELWRYPDLELRLGRPVGHRARAGPCVWRREFSGGVALVNVDGSEHAELELGRLYRTPEGRPVERVSLPPLSGIVLRLPNG